jgi:hypothetical protein
MAVSFIGRGIMKPLKFSLLGILASVVVTQSVSAMPVTESNLPSWNGTTSIGDFGSSGFSTWGQTVLMPAGAQRLVDFTFMLSDAIQGTSRGEVPVPVQFHAYVAQFNTATRTVGPLLYTSEQITVPVTTGLGFSPYTFAPDIAVTAGSTYLLFLFADNYTLQIPDDSRLRLGSPDPFGNTYSGGGMAFVNSAEASLSDALAASWFGGTGLGGDLAFSATFDTAAAVPEPASLAILGFGVAALGFGRRRRTR